MTLLSLGQKGKNNVTSFDIEDFNKKFEVAEWLCKYDMIAWWTSDSAMTQDKKEIERLGKEWFCFQDQSYVWHAVYGKYENGIFDLVFHFTVDINSKVKRIYDKVDTILLNSYSRALITANNQINEVSNTNNLRFNQFIKQNENNTFSVWIFPAFQPNSTAVYGGEFIYIIDNSGTKILSNQSYFQGDFRGFKVDEPREIWLNYRDTEKPTLGAIFFVWYYKQYFTSIYIDCSKSNSTAFKHEDNTYTWIHAVKEPKNKKDK